MAIQQKKYLLEHQIRHLDRPVCSSDLNFTEKLWVLQKFMKEGDITQ